jgi:hypothetical protein
MIAPLYRHFCALPISHEAIGFMQNFNDLHYFCTPLGAEIIGSLGVDGIHFCRIPSLDADMIFAVTPIPCGDRHVEPVARDFQDFLSLLLACKHTSLLEQISYFRQEQFFEMLQSTDETESPDWANALRTLHTDLALMPHPNPYHHVKSLQSAFDHTTIPFSDEYYDLTGIER